MSAFVRPPFRFGLAAYNIANAALFDGSTGYFSRTFGTPTDGKTWTLSIRVLKLAGDYWGNPFISAGADNGSWGATASGHPVDALIIYIGNYLKTSQLFRDYSGFITFTLVYDSTEATAADRIKLFTENSQVTAFSTATYPALNATSLTNSAIVHNIGRTTSGSAYSKDIIAEVHFIDGQALTPADFGETDTATGNWKAKAYTGTYGTNGFYLDFSNPAALGTDASGNGNDWTVNGTVTQVTSTPTNVYCSLDPSIAGTTATLIAGNTKMSSVSSTQHKSAGGSMRIPPTGQWGWRVTSASSANNEDIGVAGLNYNPQLPAAGAEVGTRATDYVYRSNAVKVNSGSSVAYGATFTSGDNIDVGCDADAGTIEFFKNGVSQGVAFTGVDFSQVMVPGGSNAETSATTVYDFTTAPAGYLTLCTGNLPKITDSIDNHFVVDLDTGANIETTAKANFTNYMTWIKDRANVNNHQVMDTARGATNVLQTNTTAAQTTYTAPTGNSVAWTFNLPNTKTSGWLGSPTITPSKEIYNDSAMFKMSIVAYTGNGTVGATIPHSLGVAPGMVIIKKLSASASWAIWHQDLPDATYFLEFDADAQAVNANMWNSTTPTSTLISFGNNDQNNASGGTYVAYIFAPSDGIKIGSYTGNGSADGPFVNAGISPIWSLFKSSGATGSWSVLDSVRDTYNPVDTFVYANSSAAENTFGDGVDYTAVGMKNRSTNGNLNPSASMIYMMIGQPQSPTENPAR